jgi:lipid II:glycine glycyltransferase (peptidoglycan interpeptide bridge formation enzyme)
MVENSVPPASTPAAVWNDGVRDHGGHLLQTWQWGEFKAGFGWQPERISVRTPDGEVYAQVLFRQRGLVSIGYVPRGPVIAGNADRVWPAFRDELDRVAKRHRAMSVILEPDVVTGLTLTYEEAGLVPGPAHLQPARTVKVPLLDDDAILKQMHQKTRYSVRLATRRGVEVQVKAADDTAALRHFYAMMLDTADRNAFSVHAYEYYESFLRTFGDDAFFVFAISEGQVAAAVISACFGEHAVYMYGASSTEHRGHGAAFLLQFEAMKWARERGCSTYDLWGIPTQDPDSLSSDDNTAIAGSKGDDWRGIFRFKTGFGGEIVSYPETLERRYLPLLPWLARRLGVIQG